MKANNINDRWEEVSGLTGLYIKKGTYLNQDQTLDPTKRLKIEQRKAELEAKIRDIKAKRLSI